MERLDKDSNRSFYDTEREHDRGRFSTEPSKVHTARLLVPWIVSRLERHDRVLDIAGYATGVVLGLYFLGVFTKVHEPAALASLLLIVALTLPLKFTTKLALPWYAPPCSLGMLPLGLAAEWKLPKQRTDVT